MSTEATGELCVGDTQAAFEKCTTALHNFCKCYATTLHYIDIDADPGVDAEKAPACQESNYREYKRLLPIVFHKILEAWKEAPVSNNWAMERFMEVFCQDVAHDAELLKDIKFGTFLKAFFEEGLIIQYADFLMNNVSLMSTKTLLFGHDGLDRMDVSADFAFKIIRCPLQNWMVNKGHRAHVAFKCLSQFLEHRVMLHSLHEYAFDAAIALSYAVASPQNYTRRSASDYFIELVKFSCDSKVAGHEGNHESNLQQLSEIQAKLRENLLSLISQFCERLDCKEENRNSQLESSAPQSYLSMSVNYCRLICQCVEVCGDLPWLCGHLDILQWVLKKLSYLCCHELYVAPDLLVPFTRVFIDLISNSAEKDQKMKDLITFVIEVCKTDKHSTICDGLAMAKIIISSGECKASDEALFLELCLLPLFILFRVEAPTVLGQCPLALDSVKRLMNTGNNMRTRILIQTATEAAFDLAFHEVGKRHHPLFLEYLTLTTLDAPREVAQPILYKGLFRTQHELDFIVCAFTCLEKEFMLKQNIERKAAAVQVYAVACLQFPSVSHAQLGIVLGVHLTVLKHLMQVSEGNRDAGIVDLGLLENGLQSLQMKMVSMDADVREIALKAVGDLYLLGMLMLLSPTCTIRMKSVWKCIEDMSEDVAIRVLDIIHSAAQTGGLDNLLGLIAETKETLVSRVEKFILSSRWSSIKVKAFQVLTDLLPQVEIVPYADVCLRQENPTLSAVVLNYINNLITPSLGNEDLDLHLKINALILWLQQGWGDLILGKANPQDITSFRQVSEIMISILRFMERDDVSEAIRKRGNSFLVNVSGSVNEPKEIRPGSIKHFCKQILERQLASASGTIGEMRSSKLALGLEDICEPGLEQPPNKKQKNLETVVDMSPDGFVLNSKAACVSSPLIESHRESTDERCVLELSYEKGNDKGLSLDSDFLDSTKELPPLLLKKDAFPLQTLVEELYYLLYPSGYPHALSVKSFLYWQSFQDVLYHMNPSKMAEEALCSTDEYNKNSVMLLHDLTQVLDTSLTMCHENLQLEIAGILIRDLNRVADRIRDVKDDSTKQILFSGITRFTIKVSEILNNTASVLKFILKQRRCLLVTSDVSERFVLDQFLDKLSHMKMIEKKEFFLSQEGLSDLLDVFINRKSCIENKTSLPTGLILESELCEGRSAHEKTDKTCGAMSMIRNLSVILKRLSPNINELKTPLHTMQSHELSALTEIFTDGVTPVDSLRERVVALIESDNKGMFETILTYILEILKLLVLIVLECNHTTEAETYSILISCTKMLEEWFQTDDDDFDIDGDNDPTAVDCF